jgi:Fe-S cluster assembly iron-binding protein IscA
MLKITAQAKQKLRDAILKKTHDPSIAVRVVPGVSNPEHLEFAFGRYTEGDVLVKSQSGQILLFIGKEIAPRLEGMIIDWKKAAKGAGFTILKQK